MKHHLSTYNIHSVQIGHFDIVTSTTVKNLGVVFDSHMSMDVHVKSTVRSAYIAIHNIGRIRHYLDMESTEKLIHAFLPSRLDYCNSLLYGVANNILCHLQRIQTTAARLVASTLDRCTETSIASTPDSCRLSRSHSRAPGLADPAR